MTLDPTAPRLPRDEPKIALAALAQLAPAVLEVDPHADTITRLVAWLILSR